MKTLQLNAEIYKALGMIADDETLMRKVLKYVRQLAKKRNEDATMTEEAFYNSIDEALQQAKEGRTHKMLSNEPLDKFLDRMEA